MCAIWINYTKRHYDGTPTDSKAKEIAFNSLKLYTHSNKLQTGCSATVKQREITANNSAAYETIHQSRPGA